MAGEMQIIPEHMKPLDVIRFTDNLVKLCESERVILLDAFQMALKPAFMVALHPTPQQEQEG